MRINEGREIAESDMRRRMRHLERGGRPACPEHYLMWERRINGDYGAVGKISLQKRRGASP
jgi:hypothetical protein